jgi:hypothetical protein
MEILEQNIIKELEPVNQLFRLVEDHSYLVTSSSVHQGSSNGNFMSFDMVCDDEDGTFPLIMHYVNLCNRVDKHGASEFINWIGEGNKLNIDQGYCTIIRKNKWDNEATLLFKEPINVQVGELNDEPLIVKVNRIVGEFEIDFLWCRNGRQNKIANIIELYFDCKGYYFDK